MNRILFVSLILPLFLGCASRYKFTPPSPDFVPTKVDRKWKVAYLGFHTFKSSVLRNQDGTIDFEALIEPGMRSLPSPILGTFPNPEELKSTANRKDIPEDKVQSFAKDYLSQAGPSGVKEIEKFVEIRKEGEAYKYSLKTLPFDYYVIGIHAPTLEKTSASVGMNFVTIFSTLFSVVTLGILPSYESYQAYTKVIVYDKNLNKVKDWQYDNSYTVWRALWISPNPKECSIGSLGCLGMFSPSVQTNQPLVFAGTIPKVQSDLQEFFAKSK
ncbi:hypothetical protein CH373_17800 [Leptospira perolatii]|uniref:Lipoprotein n=1 Tax=Leptospira perolatii TaxID=2023191 RepID=A0A2M9ZI85_9LEPT|nr:hypothetical protein [Leptospira perolatii]PJZ68233.1 hypothetical protein CH360_17375 [Leptospira perolatii]PJZ71780.1 hypothetical protein CH373_17800 [Leptospira perolatii]